MIARGTTPTIRYTFSLVDVSAIVVAYLTIKQGSLVIEKDLTSATIGDGYLEWTLTQEETLSLAENKEVKIQCRYRTNEGMAYASRIETENTYKLLKSGEI